MIALLLVAVCLSSFLQITSAADGVSEACVDPKNKQICEVRAQLVAVLYNLDEQLLHEDGLKEKRKSSFVRFGRNMPEDDRDKRKSSFVRFGRSDPEDSEVEKRKSSFVRFGRAGDDLAKDSMEKRKSSYVRFG